MNVIAMTKHSIHTLAKLIQPAPAPAAGAVAAPAPRAYRTQVVAGAGMVRVVELGTGRVLGFRRTITEAYGLAGQLERGERPQVAA